MLDLQSYYSALDADFLSRNLKNLFNFIYYRNKYII